MQLLPKWVLPPTFPSVYDSQSATVIEMTAQVYGAMNKLIEEYNSFADVVNQQLTTFSKTEKAEREEFETNITKVMRQFTACMDQYLRLNLTDTATNLINEAILNGTIKVTEVYNPDTESLNIVTGGNVSG